MSVTNSPPLLQAVEDVVQPEHRSCCRYCATALVWFLFSVCLAYGSGLPLVVAVVLQQVGRLPTDEGTLQFVFPTAFGKIHADAAGRVDLVNQDYLSMTIPWWAAAMALEAALVRCLLPAERRPKHVYRINDTISSLSTGLLYVLITKVVLLDWGKSLYGVVYNHWRLTDRFQDPWDTAAWWLSFFAADVFYYLGHRAAHYFSWMWMDHIVHHSSEEYNLSTALRQPAVDFLSPNVFIFTLPMALLFPPELTSFQAQFGLMYQFWIHTQLVPALPYIELIFNTASLHRIHHARNIRALGKNYGSVFSLWDRLGGTFEPEAADPEPLYYGIIPPLNSWNPFWANVCHIHYMLFKQRKWHGWRTPFVHWTPPNSCCPRLGSSLNPHEKFDAVPSSCAVQVYVVIEFLLVLLGGVVMLFAPDPSAWTKSDRSAAFAAGFAACLFSLVCVASLESARTDQALRRALAADLARQLALAAAAAGWLVLASRNFTSRKPAIAAVLAYLGVHLAFLSPIFLGTLKGSSRCND